MRRVRRADCGPKDCSVLHGVCEVPENHGLVELVAPSAFEVGEGEGTLHMIVSMFPATASSVPGDHRALVLTHELDRLTIEGCDSLVQSIFSASLSLEHCRAMLREGSNDSDMQLRVAVDGLNQAIDAIRAYAQGLAAPSEHWMHTGAAYELR